MTKIQSCVGYCVLKSKKHTIYAVLNRKRAAYNRILDIPGRLKKSYKAGVDGTVQTGQLQYQSNLRNILICWTTAIILNLEQLQDENPHTHKLYTHWLKQYTGKTWIITIMKVIMVHSDIHKWQYISILGQIRQAESWLNRGSRRQEIIE
jgi:hypothetical protein